MLFLAPRPTTATSASVVVTTLPRGGAQFLDYDPEGYVAQECSRCTDRRTAVMFDCQGYEVVREWHEPNCPALLELL